MMNDNNPHNEQRGAFPSYSGEYVELKTELRDLAGVFKAELAKVLAKLESVEHCIRDVQRDNVRLENQVQSHREAIGSLKTAASILGAIGGIAVSFLLRFLGNKGGP